MRLEVSHKTTYRYETPIDGLVQSLRLTPSLFDGQRVLSWQITVTGGVKGGTFRDGAGDLIESWSVKGPISEVDVEISGVVETLDTAGILKGHREIIQPMVYLRPTPATGGSQALEALALGAEGDNPLALAHALSEAVSDAIRYVPGVTGAKTTAAEALALGEGVCQDHAHALIAVAHVRGLPARYVSGYLLADGSGQPHEAAHAWAEIHVGALGWVGFDAANRCCPNENYIRLASGFDAADAAPVSGVAIGCGMERMDVSVSVLQVEQ